MFFHGTSTAVGLGPGDVLLSPVETGRLRESWRRNYQDRVFVTDSFRSAHMYAMKAAQAFGGLPVVFVVAPDECSLIPRHNHEFLSDFARVVRVYKK